MKRNVTHRISRMNYGMKENTEVDSKPYFLLSSINYVIKGFRHDVKSALFGILHSV